MRGSTKSRAVTWIGRHTATRGTVVRGLSATLALGALALVLAACGSSSTSTTRAPPAPPPRLRRPRLPRRDQRQQRARRRQAGGHDRRQELRRGEHPGIALRAGAAGQGLQGHPPGKHRLHRDHLQGHHRRADRHVPRVHRRAALGGRRTDQEPRQRPGRLRAGEGIRRKGRAHAARLHAVLRLQRARHAARLRHPAPPQQRRRPASRSASR